LVFGTASFEETDDAYVAGNQVQIMAQVSGSVTKVWADNTDYVQKGDPLVTLDQTDAQQAFEKAKPSWPPACVKPVSR
jgi:membrane fusion protein (multidrug efflux system)